MMCGLARQVPLVTPLLSDSDTILKSTCMVVSPGLCCMLFSAALCRGACLDCSLTLLVDFRLLAPPFL